MITRSKHNIFSQIRNSENYFLVNLLSGNADILNPDEASRFRKTDLNNINQEDEFTRELISKGYLTDDDTEKKLFQSKYLDFIDSREKDEIQLFFVTNYTCNFACSYCYQSSYQNSTQEFDRNVTEAFFAYINKEFQGRKKYITVFGGEPLLPGERHKSTIEYLVKRSKQEKIELCFVTNGYYLEEYSDILREGLIREIQVTLDGTGPVHDKRRFLKGGQPTFDKIVRGIDKCLESNIAINLRMVADRENIDNLPELAMFAIEKGWTEKRNFKTQIGRNYELHSCQSSPEKLFDRLSLYERIAELVRKHPHITRFHKPAFSVSKFLSENGALPDPLFDSCPACKTEWAFDFTGHIYPCTATVGKAEESLGTFFPAKHLYDDRVLEWETRDITSIDRCKECNLSLACGGGCGSVAKNTSGNVCASDCRPVKGLLEIGFSLYTNEEK
jgi:uncharacterized protein